MGPACIAQTAQPPTSNPPAHRHHLITCSWFTNFAAAADQVGIPVCLSLALVDMGTQEAVEERTFHVTGPPRGASKGSKGSGSGR